MRRRGPGDGVVTVELLEGDNALAPPLGPDDDGGGPDAARARRLRWVGLAVVVALLGTILTATVVDARRETARRAALAELGWVLPPIGGPLEEVWRASGGWVIAAIDDVLVLQDTTDGSWRALNADTGAVLWDRPGGTAESCFPVYDYRASDQQQYPAAETLVCAHDYLWADAGPPEPGATVSLVPIDIATGAELLPLVIEGGVVVQDAADDDLLITFVDSEAAIGVVRWDPREGEVWSYRSAPGLLTNAFWDFQTGYLLGEDTLRLTDDLALDPDTGREVAVDPTLPDPDRDQTFAGSLQELADGGRVEWLWDTSSSGYATPGRVLNEDGSLRFEVDGEPWFLWIGDGSAPETIMTIDSDGTVVARDPRSGDELWSAPELRDTWPAFLLDGIIVAGGPTSVTALDGRDGTVLWRVDTRWAANSAAPTDGDVVLVQVSERPGSVILGVELQTGAEVWRIPGTSSGSYWQLMPASDGFLLVSDTEIIRYR